MGDSSIQKAISQALSGNWKEAAQTNLEILKSSPKDVDALNRLGRAYLELGHKSKAIEAFEKALKLDKFNTIALKNLNLVKSVKMRDRKASTIGMGLPAVFLEEPGVTKTIALTRLGDPKLISTLQPGSVVKIVARGHVVAVITDKGQYLGRLPDDLASRLRTFLQAGNTYTAWIRNCESTGVKVFIRETKRVSKYRNNPSFPLTEKLTYAAFTPPELVHQEKPDTASTEMQDDSDADSTSREPEEEEVSTTALE